MIAEPWSSWKARAAASSQLEVEPTIRCWWRARLADARRWVADPPGPSREAPPPTTAEHWLTGRRAVALLVGLLLLGLVVGVVVAVTARA